jgi:hypothetical protein
MFTAQALVSLLPLVTAKKIDDEDSAIREAAVAYVDGFVRPDLMDVVAATRMTPASAELTAAVPADWCNGGTLLVGRVECAWAVFVQQCWHSTVWRRRRMLYSTASAGAVHF